MYTPNEEQYNDNWAREAIRICKTKEFKKRLQPTRLYTKSIIVTW